VGTAHVLNLCSRDLAEVEHGLDDRVAGFERRATRRQELQHRVEKVRLTGTSPNLITLTPDRDVTWAWSRCRGRTATASHRPSGSHPPRHPQTTRLSGILNEYQHAP
jgi:hypothetical protein